MTLCRLRKRLREARAQNDTAIMSVEEKLTKIGLKLPCPPASEGAYLGAKLSGKIAITCRVCGNDLTLQEGYIAAQETCLNCLAQLNLLGSLERIKQALQVIGFVNSS